MQYKKVETIYRKPMRDVGRKRYAYVVKNYQRFIDYRNYVLEMSYGRLTDAIATTNIISVERVMKEFKIEDSYMFLTKEEQDIFDIEKILLELDIPETSINSIIAGMLRTKSKTISYILNKVSAKFYVADYYNTIPERIFPHSYKNLKQELSERYIV